MVEKMAGSRDSNSVASSGAMMVETMDASMAYLLAVARAASLAGRMVARMVYQ